MALAASKTALDAGEPPSTPMRDERDATRDRLPSKTRKVRTLRRNCTCGVGCPGPGWDKTAPKQSSMTRSDASFPNQKKLCKATAATETASHQSI